MNRIPDHTVEEFQQVTVAAGESFGAFVICHKIDGCSVLEGMEVQLWRSAGATIIWGLPVKHLLRSAYAVLGLCVLGVLILGIALWQGKLYEFLGLHMALGLTFVLCVWVVAIVAITAGVSTQRAFLLLALGIAIILLGLGQVRVLLGPLHWIVRTGHLLMGLMAIVQTDLLARALRGHYGIVGASNLDSTASTHSPATRSAPL